MEKYNIDWNQVFNYAAYVAIAFQVLSVIALTVMLIAQLVKDY